MEILTYFSKYSNIWLWNHQGVFFSGWDLTFKRSHLNNGRNARHSWNHNPRNPKKSRRENDWNNFVFHLIQESQNMIQSYFTFSLVLFELFDFLRLGIFLLFQNQQKHPTKRTPVNGFSDMPSTAQVELFVHQARNKSLKNCGSPPNPDISWLNGIIPKRHEMVISLVCNFLV